MKLRLEDLKVDSFITKEEVKETKGTVKGNAYTQECTNPANGCETDDEIGCEDPISDPDVWSCGKYC